MSPFWKYLKDGTKPEDKATWKKVRRYIHLYKMEDDIVYRLGGINNSQLFVPARLREEIMYA